MSTAVVCFRRLWNLSEVEPCSRSGSPEGQVLRFGALPHFLSALCFLPVDTRDHPPTSCFCCHAFPATVHGSFLKLEVEIVASSLKLLLVVIATRKVTNLLYVWGFGVYIKVRLRRFFFLCVCICVCVYVCTSLWQPGVDTRWLPLLLCLMFWDGHLLNLVFTDSVTLMGSRDDHGRTDVSIRHWLHCLWDSWVKV